MPGARITRWLAAGNYDTFYALVHAYSEVILVAAHGLRSSVLIIERLTGNMRGTPGYAYIDEIHELAAEAVASTDPMPERVRRVFWPRDAVDITDPAAFEALYRARWAPFTGEVWDELVAQLSHVVLPWLREVDPISERLSIMVDAEINRWLEHGVPDDLRTLQRSVAFLERASGQVRSCLDPDSLESLYLPGE